MASNSKRSRDDQTKFTEAEKNWNLEKLYEDLRDAKQRCGSAKRKVLTDIEKCHLRGLLCGYSPEKIASERRVGFGTVNDALSKTLYCYIEEMLEYKKKIRHWGDVPDFLELAGYKIQGSEQFQPSHPLLDKKENILEISHEVEVSSIREWRFKSVDQLWSKDIGERISGIRKLERIAKDYPTEHWAIMEELAEFIRIKAPRQEGEEARSLKISEDIQAALTVIGRRDPKKDPKKRWLNLHNTDIRGADLIEANLQRVELCEANLQGVDFWEANSIGVNLQKADLQRAGLSRATLERATLREAILQKADLEETNLEGADLEEANLKEANFFKAKLQGATLRRANLEGADLKEANLQGANLSKANLEEADLRKANLQGADLTGANLQVAELSGANLQGVNLRQTNLKWANLSHADLKEADFTQANLEGTALCRAELSGVKNLKLEQLKLAYGDSQTSLPEELNEFKEEILVHWEQSGS